MSAVSVVIPTYNRAALVARAVQSALAAAEEDDQIIVVDDASTDNTVELLAPFWSRIEYVRAQRGGAGKARNLGIRLSRNPLIAFLDSDDEWFADKLVLQKAVMDARPDVLFCFSDFGVKHAASDAERRYLQNWHHDKRSWDEILGTGPLYSHLNGAPKDRDDFKIHIGNLYLAEMQRPYVFTSTFVVRREEAASALHFAEDVSTFEDWECFGRIARAGSGAFLDCETAWQWGHAGPRLTDANALQCLSASIKILTRVWGSDTAFLERHGGAYGAKLEAERLAKVRYLISAGRTREARGELSLMAKSPAHFRLLAAMPELFMRPISNARRRLLSFVPKSKSIALTAGTD